MRTILVFILLLVDFLALFSALHVANLLLSQDLLGSYMWMVCVPIFLFLYENIYLKRFDFWGDLHKIFKSLFLSLLLIFSFITLSKNSQNYSSGLILLFFTLSLFFVPLAKRVAKNMLFRFDAMKLRVKILADEKRSKTIEKELYDNWYLGHKAVDKEFEMILISSQSFKIEELLELINSYMGFTKDIYIIPYLQNIDFTHSQMSSYSNIRVSAFHIENRLINRKNRVLKFTFERVLTVALLPFVLLLHLFISIAIKLDSKGSVIFKQKRLGRDSKPFDCYKYRSMYEDSDYMLNAYLSQNPDEVKNYEVYHKYENDPRITKIGKILRASSLDELPQFLNILKGEMNLIGPRPYMVEEGKNMHDDGIILKVAPGITGLWQVSGRNSLTFKERVELDIWYIQNWSLWMDFVIFLKTIKVVFSKIGAR